MMILSDELVYSTLTHHTKSIYHSSVLIGNPVCDLHVFLLFYLGHLLDILMSKYAKFFVRRMMKYG